MKRLFLGVCAFALLTCFSTYAGDDGDVRIKEKAKLTKEERKLRRQQKQDARKLKREQQKEMNLAKKAEDKEKKSVKKEKKSKKTEKVKKEKQHKKSKEERNLDRQHKNVEKQISQEQRQQRKVNSREERKLEKIHKVEKKKAQAIENENKAKIRKEQHRLRKQQRKEAEHMAILNEQKERVDKLAKINAEKENNSKLVQTWNTVRAASVESNYKEGKYADLYMLPAWPVASWFYKDKALINATAFYHYATDAYDSDGASRNITALAFGESPIHIKDIVLASKLFNDFGTDVINFRSPSWVSPINNLVRYFGDQEIELVGRTEQYGLSLDFMRHVLRDDISIGIQVPMMFMRNRLKVNMDFPTDYDFYNEHGVLPEYEFTSHPYYEALKRIFREKDINEFGGSASGIGDITLFGNIEITTKWIEKIVAGVKFVLPTGKKASAKKLWAPEMGNGGCTEMAAFISLLTKYNRYINPHLFLQAAFNIPVHVDRRVPRSVDFESTDPENQEDLPIDLMSLADRLAGRSFSEWDSSIRGFSDKIVSVKYEKAPEITARVGNVFDKFLFRRGFMDIFYNLRVKFEDSYRQVNRDMYKIDMLEDNTRQVEHRLGFEYSHQFDSRTRMKAGMVYTFAGVNTPKAFDLGVSFAHSF